MTGEVAAFIIISFFFHRFVCFGGWDSVFLDVMGCGVLFLSLD